MIQKNLYMNLNYIQQGQINSYLDNRPDITATLSLVLLETSERKTTFTYICVYSCQQKYRRYIQNHNIQFVNRYKLLRSVILPLESHPDTVIRDKFPQDPQ